MLSSIKNAKPTQRGLFSAYLTVAVVLILSFIYLDLPSYLWAVLKPNLLPKYSYYILFAIVLPLCLVNFKQFIWYMSSPFFLWVCAEILIHSYDLIEGNEAVVQRVWLRDQYLILSVFLGFALSITRTEFYEKLIRILAIIIPILVIIDFISPGIFYPIGTKMTVQGRASAMYINPTRAGEVILVTCLLAMPVMCLQYRMFLLLLAGVALLVTFSRGPILLWMLFWLYLLTTRKLPPYGFVFLLIIIVALPLLLSIFKSYLMKRQDIDYGLDNIITRLDFFQTRSLNEDSAQERIAVLESGRRIFLENPIFGAGTGITDFPSNMWPHDVNTHNQIVMVAAEQGIFGIGLWIWLLVILWKGRYFRDTRFQLVATMGVFFMSFFTHLMMTELYWLMSYALISGRRQA